MGFVLFLFLSAGGPGPHANVTATTATFKTQAACEAALTQALAVSDTVAGFCAPTKVKAPKR